MKEEALKLAEERAENPYLDPEANAQDFKKLAEMIRRLVEELDKQEAEIDRLNLELGNPIDYEEWGKHQVAVDKPFAWSCWNDDMPSAIITYTEPSKYDWMSIKPLYTTPQTKPVFPIEPLSDEKIKELALKHLSYVTYDEGEYGIEVDIFGEIEFYDAIIEELNKKAERHGIK